MRNICYIDLGPNELMHWKYIKRVKLSNGKYRYYYDESDLRKYENEAIRAEKESNRALINAVKRGFENDKAREESDKDPWSLDKMQKSNDTYTRARLTAKVYDEKYEKAVKASRKYEVMKIASFPARTISKGMVAIANLFNGNNAKDGRSKGGNRIRR